MSRIATDVLPAPTLGQETRTLLVLGVPLIGSSLAQFAIGLTDTLILGWYDVTALAASTLANAFYFLLFLMGAGFGRAVMPLVASAVATGDAVQVRRTTRMGLWLSAGFGFVVTVPLMWSGTFFRAIGQDPEVSDLAQAFLRIAGWALIPGLLVSVMRSYLSALGRTGVILWATIGAAVLNAVLNWIFVFGNLGAPELGIRGSAIASLGSVALSATALFVYALVVTPEYRLFQRLWRIDPGAMKMVFRLGVPIGLTSLAETALFSASAVMMGWIGAIELAAHGIALILASAAFMLHVGLSEAATVEAGRAFGTGDVAKLRRVGIAAIGTSLFFVVLTVILFTAIPETLIGWFIDPADPRLPELLPVGVSLLMLAALFNLVDSEQVIALGLLRGVQDTTVPMILAIVSYWLVGLPLGYVLGFHAGMAETGVWLGLVAGLAAAAISLMARFWFRAVRIGA